MDDQFKYLEQLGTIAKGDELVLRDKERTYQGSWKKRGGPGAFMMLARKWDRIEAISRGFSYDIFQVIRDQGLVGDDGTLIAEIRDLRRYLSLVEAEMMEELEGSEPTPAYVSQG